LPATIAEIYVSIVFDIDDLVTIIV
jgi:hypothetical protein